MTEIVSQLLVQVAIPALAAIVMAFVPFFVHRIVLAIEKKCNIQLDAAYETKLVSIFTKGLVYAEEKAVTAVKAGQGSKPTGIQKMEWAVDLINDELERNGLDKIEKDKLVKLIEATLGQARKEV